MTGAEEEESKPRHIHCESIVGRSLLNFPFSLSPDTEKLLLEFFVLLNKHWQRRINIYSKLIKRKLHARSLYYHFVYELTWDDLFNWAKRWRLEQKIRSSHYHKKSKILTLMSVIAAAHELHGEQLINTFLWQPLFWTFCLAWNLCYQKRI